MIKNKIGGSSVLELILAQVLLVIFFSIALNNYQSIEKTVTENESFVERIIKKFNIKNIT